MDFVELSHLCDQKDKIIQMQFSLIESALKPTMTITEKTLRDEYAMAALNGLLSNNISVSLAVVRAVEAADLMMEKRK
jgi:hypothetical protein